MAIVELKKLFVNLAATGEAVSGQSARDRGESWENPGEVLTYGGGRQRAESAEGEAGSYSFTLLLIPRTAVETLRSWKGRVVQVRDNKGRRLFGVYFKTPIAEIVSRSTWNVSVDMQVVTVDEGA